MKKRWLMSLLLGSIALSGIAADRLPARPAPEGGFVSPCEGAVWWAESDATFEDFDFWVGEWQVHDRITGDLLGFDEVEKIHEGCAIQQNWRQMNDRFSLPGAPWRYAGGSVTALGVDGAWKQRWIDNGGGNLPLSGGFDNAGDMVLESRWLSYTQSGLEISVRYRWHWSPKEDGTILNWGFIDQKIGAGSPTGWVQYFDIVYNRNVPGGAGYELDPNPE